MYLASCGQCTVSRRYSKRVSPLLSTLRTVLRDNLRSRAIWRIDFLSRAANRIFLMVSTVNILLSDLLGSLANTPPRSMVEGGSVFDADHPSRWVIFARRFTLKILGVEVRGLVRFDRPRDRAEALAGIVDGVDVHTPSSIREVMTRTKPCSDSLEAGGMNGSACFSCAKTVDATRIKKIVVRSRMGSPSARIGTTRHKRAPGRATSNKGYDVVACLFAEPG